MTIAPYLFHEVIGSLIVVVIGRPGEFVSTVLSGFHPEGSHFEPHNIESHTELDRAVYRARQLAIGVRLGGMCARQALDEIRALEVTTVKRRRKRAA